MSVQKLSLAALDSAITSAVTAIETKANAAISEVVGTATEDGFSSYNKCSTLYALADANTANDDHATLLATLKGTGTLPTGLGDFEKIGTALQGIDSAVNLTDADEDFDTLAEIVSYMIENDASVEEWLEKNVIKKAINSGSSTFSVTDNYTAITFTKARPNANYTVLVMPSANPSAAIGEIYVAEKTVTGFKVVITGTATTAFDWVAFDDFSVASDNTAYAD